VSGRDAVGNRRSALLIINAFSSRHLLSPQVAGSPSPTRLFGPALLIDEVFLNRLTKSPEEDPRAAALEWNKVWGNSLRWEDLGWLRSLTSLPMLLKGIQHPDDVRRARDYGVDGIYCSNHGGRQANGGLPALDALPAVVEAAERMPVLFDSGVRSGSDVAKALALGATAVGIGRPYAYALAVGGTDGVVAQLRAILAELDLLMAIDGYPTIADLRAAGAQRI
jgi:lactate 2-monooxygenase